MNRPFNDTDDETSDPEYIRLTGRDDAYPDIKGVLAFLDRHPTGGSDVIYTFGKRLVRWVPTDSKVVVVDGRIDIVYSQNTLRKVQEFFDGLFQVFNSQNALHREQAARTIQYILQTNHPLGADLKGQILCRADVLAHGLRSVFMGLTDGECQDIARQIDLGVKPNAPIPLDSNYRWLIGEMLWFIRDSLSPAILATVSDVIASAYFHPKDQGIVDLVRLVVARGGPTAAQIKSFVLARTWHPSIRQSLEAIQVPRTGG